MAIVGFVLCIPIFVFVYLNKNPGVYYWPGTGPIWLSMFILGLGFIVLGFAGRRKIRK